MRKNLRSFFLILYGALLLNGCNIAVFDTKGLIAAKQADLIITSVMLMLIVVIPVFILTFVFAFKYRASNPKAKYTPEWEHNNALEVIWWTIPIIIIVILGVITWKSSHELDPYKPLVSDVKPIEIEVVALDWKWLFLYPEQGIASVNLAQFPINVPVNFKITAQAPMNSFWIPRLAGQIYAMEGMQTKLHIISDVPGSYEGVSANFSGAGFNGMKFIAKASSAEDFNRWVDSVKHVPDSLTQERYDALAKQSSNEPVRVYSQFREGLFMNIMMRYMEPNCGADSHDSMDGKQCCKRPMHDPALMDSSSHEHCKRHTQD